MANLIDGLLALARVSRSELRVTRVDLSSVVRGIAERLRGAEPARPVEFVIQQDIVESGDPNLLGVVLDNLLGNAWKFTSKRDVARIEFGQVRDGYHRVTFVRDNGAGFDPIYAGRLFGVFQRLHSSTEFEGTGIGLATVHRVIRRHGGRVWAEGCVDRGATFHFTLGEREPDS